MTIATESTTQMQSNPIAVTTAQPPAGHSRYIADVPQSGEHFAFVASARTAADGRFRFVWTLAPGKTGPGEHLHPDETETFEVISGTLRIWIDDVPRDYGPGDVAVVPAGVRHRFLNPGTEPVVVNVNLDGSQMEDLLVPLAVAVHGRGPKAGEMMRLLVTMERKASIPTRALERWGIGALIKTLKLFGVKPWEPVYGWDRDGAAA